MFSSLSTSYVLAVSALNKAPFSKGLGKYHHCVKKCKIL